MSSSKAALTHMIVEKVRKIVSLNLICSVDLSRVSLMKPTGFADQCMARAQTQSSSAERCEQRKRWKQTKKKKKKKGTRASKAILYITTQPPSFCFLPAIQLTTF